MRTEGIKARAAKRSYNRPHMNRFYACVPNRAREVEVTRPDQVWVGDITYFKVGTIYRYLAVVMDKYSRRILSWAFGKAREAKLTLRALNRAVRKRCPPRGLIFHSDRGMEYASSPFKARLAQVGLVQSMAKQDERQRLYRILLPLDED